MSSTMRGVLLTGHGGLEKLEYRDDVPKPVPGPHEVLVRVLACGLNNTDINTRVGWYSKGVTDATASEGFASAVDDDAAWGGAPIRFPRIQGADICGVVEGIGRNADPRLIGERVMIDTWLRDWNDPDNLHRTGYFGSECDGGYAEFTAIDQRQVHVVRSAMSDAEIATFATSYTTAENMLNRASVGEDDTVLISGASGGVGSALIQLANRRGAKTVAICSPAKMEAVGALNPTAMIPRGTANMRVALRQAIGASTVSVFADVVGGPDFPGLVDLLERGGRYVVSGAIAGPIVDLDLRTLYLRDLTFFGSTVISHDLFPDLVGYIERDEIKPVLAQTFPLSEIHKAQEAFIAKKHVGNIVVIPGS